MKKENLQKALIEVLKPFNIEYHQNNPLGELHSAIENKAKEFGFKIDLDFPIQHVSYGETLKRNFEVKNLDEESVMNVNTATYRNDQTGNYELTAYTSKIKNTRKMKP